MDQRKKSRKKKIPGNKWKWKHNSTKFLGHIESSLMRKFYSPKCLHSKNVESTNKWLNDVSQQFGKMRTNQSKPSQFQEIIKIKAETNERERKEAIQTPMNLRAGCLNG